MIQNFMYPVSTVQKRKPAAKPVQKVNEAQSKDIMNSLFEDLDQQDAEELEQANMPQQNLGPVAFNKEEELELKYGVTVP